MQLPLIVWILAGSLVGSLVALTIAYLFLFKMTWTHERARVLISFAAGVMLAVAFLDLLPESFAAGTEPARQLMWALVGFLAFFCIEKLLFWYHCHDEHCEVHTPSYMILIGDTFHNFLDGIAIAVAFFVSIPLGFVTAAAVALHEIPQEIGDLGVLISGGMTKRRALFVNAISAGASLVGALLAFFFLQNATHAVPILLAMTAGAFIYITAADLIPEIHHERRRSQMTQQFFVFMGGVLVMYIFGLIFSV